MTKASQILAYVLKHRRPFPAEESADFTYYDLPESISFNPDAFCSVSKAEFARYYEVAPNQVTRWIDAGLPVLADGRVMLWQGHEWVQKNRMEWLMERLQRETAAFRARMDAEAANKEE